MKIRNLRLALGLAVLLALTLTSHASAHPSLYNIVGKVAKIARDPDDHDRRATGGTFKPSAGAKDVPYNAPAWQVQDALGADPAIGRADPTPASPNLIGQANVLVTGDAGGPYTLRFQGTARATTNEPQVVPDGTL